MTRQDVFRMIEQERARQNEMYARKQPPKSPSFDELNHVAQWLIYVETYIQRAKSKFLGGAGGRLEAHDYLCNAEAAQRIHKEEVLKDMVKVAALCVACLEYNGDLLEG